MSINSGDAVSAAVVNAAYVSKTADSSMAGVLSLNEVSSGGDIANAQQQINNNVANIATNTANIATNTANIATNTADIITLNNSVTFNNLSATTNPLTSSDDTEGYEIGSLWINVTQNKIFMAVDVTEDAAIWKRLDKTMLEIKSFAILDQSVSNVDDASYTEIIADVGSFDVKRIQAFYPDGDAAYIAVGAATSEVDEYILTAGGNAEVGLDVNIPANSRISIKLVSGGTTNTTGKLIMNFLGES